MSAQRLAYATDLTDEAWQLLEPLRPPGKSGGRPRKDPMRDVSTGIQSVLRGGCAWRLMPHDRPQWQTASQTCRAWRQDGPWMRIHDPLRNVVRPRMGRHPQPSAAIIETHTGKTTDKGGLTAMMARRNAPAAPVISSWRRRGSSCASSSTPPIGEMPREPPGSWPPRMRPVTGGRASGRRWPTAASGSARGGKRRAAGASTSCRARGAGAGPPSAWSRRPCRPLRCCPVGGSWNARSPGLAALAA